MPLVAIYELPECYRSINAISRSLGVCRPTVRKYVYAAEAWEGAELMIPGRRGCAVYMKPDVLIIDDFALKEFTKTQTEDLYELIDRCYCYSYGQPVAQRLVSLISQPGDS